MKKFINECYPLVRKKHHLLQIFESDIPTPVLFCTYTSAIHIKTAVSATILKAPQVRNIMTIYTEILIKSL